MKKNFAITLVDKLDRVHHVKVIHQDKEIAIMIACNRLRLYITEVRIASVTVASMVKGETE